MNRNSFPWYSLCTEARAQWDSEAFECYVSRREIWMLHIHRP